MGYRLGVIAKKTFLLPLIVAVGIALPSMARAFCGFYVAGADTKLYNNATMVTLMRDGKTTVLSMGNNYQGPPADFAMVVPVPAAAPSAAFTRRSKMARTTSGSGWRT